MSEIRPVMAATDGSDHSLRVIPHAAVLAQALESELHLVRVLEPNDVVQGPGEGADAALERTTALVEREMSAALQRAAVNARTIVEVAKADEEPSTALLRFAQDASVLAMHSRGRGGVAQLLRGSVALGVLRQSEGPVMLCGPEVLGPPARDSSYRLLITTDLSQASEQILRKISPLAGAGEFSITLLYVHLHLPAAMDNDAELRESEAAMSRLRGLLPESVSVDIQLRDIPAGGGIDTTILETARERNVHAIAMSTHGQSARQRLLMGSVAISTVRRSTLPVIVCRAVPRG